MIPRMAAPAERDGFVLSVVFCGRKTAISHKVCPSCQPIKMKCENPLEAAHDPIHDMRCGLGRRRNDGDC
jgi:hypothetical protein